MRQFALIIALLTPFSAVAEGWERLSGDEIRTALEGRKLQYSFATQDFRSSGRTLYDSGRPSWGYWRVQDDQYCSQWPPSDLWACYHMDKNGEKLRFVGDRDDVTEGVYIE